MVNCLHLCATFHNFTSTPGLVVSADKSQTANNQTGHNEFFISQSENTFFPIMTSRWPMIIDQSVGLCDWDLIHLMLQGHMPERR